MTRYSIENGDSFHGGRRYTLSASRHTARAHPIGSHIIGIQSESDNPNEKQRRRIAVACSRCRKRKIKCSGDPKNGQGCQNCRNANVDSGQCQFLRVQSQSMEVPDWPYLLSAPPTYAGNPINIYGVPVASHFSAPPPPRRLTQSWPYPSYASLQGGGNECYSYDLAPPEMYDQPYSLQPSAQGYVAAPEHPPPSQNLYPPEMLRQWPNLPKVDRPQPVAFEHHPTTTSYSSSGMTYPSSLAPITAIDPTSGFASMGALAKSLPPSHAVGDRVLPTPRAGTSQTVNDNSVAVSQPTYTDVYNTSTARPLVAWSSERATLASHLSTTHATSHSAHSLSSHCSKPLSSSPPDHASVFGYGLVTTSAGPEPISTADFVLGMTAATGGEESLIYGTPLASEGSDSDGLRGRIPSTGSFSYSGTEGSGSSKRGSISSSTTDATLLTGSTGYAVHNPHLRNIQCAQPQQAHGPSDAAARGQASPRGGPGQPGVKAGNARGLGLSGDYGHGRGH